MGTGLIYATEFDTKELLQSDTVSRRIIHIKTPLLDEDLVKEYVAGIRPMNENCPKINAEVINYHENSYVSANCWGHGGAGITLAPGSAKMVYKKIFSIANLNNIDIRANPIAILGGGINGLWTAYYFIKQGIPASYLTLYAKDFEKTVSHMAAGMWLPISMPRGEQDPEFFEQLEDDSYHAYDAIAHNKHSKIKGVQELPFYTFNMEKEAQALADRGLVPPGEQVTLKNQNNQEIEAVYWKRFFLVDPSLLMPSLKKYLEKKGITFVSRLFKKEEEFFQLEKKIIINCLGFGNSDLLEEGKRTLRPSKGELIHFSPQPDIDYMLFGIMPNNKTFGIIPRQGELIVGVTRKPGDTSLEPVPEDADEILKRGRELFGDSQKK